MSSKSGIEAGRAFVRMFLNDVELQSSLKSTTQKLKAMGVAVGQLGAQFTAMGLAAALPFAAALALFVPFSDAMLQVKAVTGATGEEFQKLNQRAKDLGRTTSFTATQVAAMMTELGRAGFNPQQIDAMIESVLNLSRASGTDAALSAGILAATIRQFSLEAADAARVADVLTHTANKTFNTVEGLGEALKYAGPVAAQLGMSLEETVAILGTLGNVGIQGSEAGTALRRLSTLSAAEAAKMQQVFGVAFLDAAGNARPLVDVLGEVGAATKDMASGERTAKFNEAFGLLGITAAQVISGVAADTRKLTSELEGLSGTAADTAKEMDEGLGGAFRIFMSAVEGVAVAISEAVEGPLKAFIGGITTVISTVSHFIERNQLLIRILAVLGPAAILIGGAFASLALAAKAVALAMAVYSAATAAAAVAQALLLSVSGPAGLALLAAGAIAASYAIYEMKQAYDEVSAEATKAAEESDKAAANLQQFKDAANAVKPPNLGTAAASNADAMAKFTSFLEAAETPAEKLRKKLAELDRTIAELGESVPADLRAKLELNIIEESTGAVSGIRKLAEEVAVLSGMATEAQIELRHMAEAGVPPQLLQRYAQLQQQRDALKKQLDEEKDAEEASQRAANQKLDDMRAQADALKNDTRTKDERMQIELANLESLRKAIDPETNTPLLDEDTYRRALEKIHKGQQDDAANTARQLQAPTNGDLRSVEGAKFLVDLFNGQAGTDQQQLTALRRQNKLTENLYTVTKQRGVIKRVSIR